VHDLHIIAKLKQSCLLLFNSIVFLPSRAMSITLHKLCESVCSRSSDAGDTSRIPSVLQQFLSIKLQPKTWKLSKYVELRVVFISNWLITVSKM
jgi:hypothetical protein